MNGNLILDSARKAILARLAALGRRFCQDDINEMVGMTVERFYTRGAYDPSRSSVRTYVSRIAFSVVYDFVKAADKARERSLDIDSFTGPEPSRSDAPCLVDYLETDSRILRDERNGLVDEALLRLDPRQQACFRLIQEGRSYGEIAILMDTSEGNVAVVACRMKKKIQAFLREVA